MPSPWTPIYTQQVAAGLEYSMTMDTGSTMALSPWNMEPYAGSMDIEYPPNHEQMAGGSCYIESTERLSTPSVVNVTDSVVSVDQHLCDQASIDIINGLYECQNRVNCSADMTLIYAQKSLNLVTRCVNEMENCEAQPSQSAFTALVCIQIVQRALSCYADLKAQPVSNEMQVDKGSIKIGEFQVHGTEMRKAILDAIITREIDLCKAIVQALQSWIDRLMMIKPEEVRVIMPFISNLQNSLISAIH